MAECNRHAVLKMACGESAGAGFERHLAACPSCAEELDSSREILRAYSDASKERYPGRMPVPVRRVVPLLAAACAALAVIFSSYLALSHREPPLTATPEAKPVSTIDSFSRSNVDLDVDIIGLKKLLNNTEITFAKDKFFGEN